MHCFDHNNTVLRYSENAWFLELLQKDALWKFLSTSNTGRKSKQSSFWNWHDIVEWSCMRVSQHERSTNELSPDDLSIFILHSCRQEVSLYFHRHYNFPDDKIVRSFCSIARNPSIFVGSRTWFVAFQKYKYRDLWFQFGPMLASKFSTCFTWKMPLFYHFIQQIISEQN